MTVILAVAAGGYFFIDQANRDKARAAAASAWAPRLALVQSAPDGVIAERKLADHGFGGQGNGLPGGGMNHQFGL